MIPMGLAPLRELSLRGKRRHVMVMYEIFSRKPTRFEVEVDWSFVRSPEGVETNPLRRWSTWLTHCWAEMLNHLDGDLTS
jgi:hypothetical protein